MTHVRLSPGFKTRFHGIWACWLTPVTEVVKPLLTDGYWERAWIVQEVGMAYRLEVCYGNSTIDWELFMSFANYIDPKARPLALHHLRQEKYSGSRSLCILVVQHQNNKCKDPRDKIYSLLGLAEDVTDFPVDYSKTLLEVAEDTIAAIFQSGNFPDTERHPFGREYQVLEILGLAKATLIGQPGMTLDPFRLSIKSDPRTTSIQIHLSSSGEVTLVGPTVRTLLSQPEALHRWKARSREFTARPDLIGQANDEMMRVLIETDDATLASACFKADYGASDGKCPYWDELFTTHASRNWKQPRQTMLPLEAKLVAFRCKADEESGRDVLDIAIAADDVEEGDLLCRPPRHSLRYHLLHRSRPPAGIARERGRHGKIMGTALTLEEVQGLKKNAWRSLTLPGKSWNYDDDAYLRATVREFLVFII